VLTESYERYIAAIDAARVTIDTSPFVRDDADRTLGRQFLRAVVNWSLAVALNLDPEHPLMQLLPDPETRLGFNNPDNLYYVARVTDTGTYRLSGHRGTSDRDFACGKWAAMNAVACETGPVFHGAWRQPTTTG
jgi:hypothetical protein